MKAWKRLDDGSTIQKVGFRIIIPKLFKMNNGKVMNAYISGHDSGEAAAVIALTPTNEVIIARQFRCGPELIMDELPGGLVDPGETPERAARRELREEVGYDSDSLEFLGAVYADGWDNMKHHFYLARDCYEIGGTNPEEFEEIEIVKISIDQLVANALAGKMIDIQAVFFAYNKLQKIKEES